NFWPMLAGIGPILGEGELGAFVGNPNKPDEIWSYNNGRSFLKYEEMAQADHPYQLKQPFPPVAVLISPLTASSGEIVVVAFRGRPNTRSFGEPTAGATTANIDSDLSDGARLFVTSAIDADRTGKSYE